MYLRHSHKSNSGYEKRAVYNQPETHTVQSHSGTGSKMPVQVPLQPSWNSSCAFCCPFLAGLCWLLGQCLPTLRTERLPQLSLSLHPGPQHLPQPFRSDIGFPSLITGCLASLPLSMAFMSSHTAAKINTGYNLVLHLVYYLTF